MFSDIRDAASIFARPGSIKVARSLEWVALWPSASTERHSWRDCKEVPFKKGTTWLPSATTVNRQPKGDKAEAIVSQ